MSRTGSLVKGSTNATCSKFGCANTPQKLTSRTLVVQVLHDTKEPDVGAIHRE